MCKNRRIVAFQYSCGNQFEHLLTNKFTRTRHVRKRSTFLSIHADNRDPTNRTIKCNQHFHSLMFRCSSTLRHALIFISVSIVVVEISKIVEKPSRLSEIFRISRSHSNSSTLSSRLLITSDYRKRHRASRGHRTRRLINDDSGEP